MKSLMKKWNSLYFIHISTIWMKDIEISPLHMGVNWDGFIALLFLYNSWCSLINTCLYFQVQKELERAQAEERKLRLELEKAKQKEEERKRQVTDLNYIWKLQKKNPYSISLFESIKQNMVKNQTFFSQKNTFW